MAKNVVFGYARISTADQKTDRQREALMPYVTNSRYYFEDIGTGTTMERARYQAMKDRIEPGDELYIHELDRLGRNKAEVLQELEYYQNLGVSVRILNIPSTLVDFSAAYGDSKIAQDILQAVNKMLLEVLAAFAEEERRTIKKRQKEGIAAARKNGVKFGRPVMQRPPTWEMDMKDWKAGRVKAVSLFRDKYKMSKSAFYKLVQADKAAEKALKKD